MNYYVKLNIAFQPIFTDFKVQLSVMKMSIIVENF